MYLFGNSESLAINITDGHLDIYNTMISSFGTINILLSTSQDVWILILGYVIWMFWVFWRMWIFFYWYTKGVLKRQVLYSGGGMISRLHNSAVKWNVYIQNGKSILLINVILTVKAVLNSDNVLTAAPGCSVLQLLHWLSSLAQFNTIKKCAKSNLQEFNVQINKQK